MENPTSCDPSGFCVQSVELRHREQGEVYVFVNFQGGWCEGSGVALAALPGNESDFLVRQIRG